MAPSLSLSLSLALADAGSLYFTDLLYVCLIFYLFLFILFYSFSVPFMQKRLVCETSGSLNITTGTKQEINLKICFLVTYYYYIIIVIMLFVHKF